MEELKNLKDEVENIEASLIDIDFISNSSNIKSKLINNKDDSFTYKLINKTYDFKLQEPIFIEKIQIQSAADDLKNTILEIHDYFTNEKISIPIENYKSHIHIAVNINRVIKSFIIKPPKRTIKIELKSIKLFGYPFSELKDISNMFKKSKNFKTELENLYQIKINDITAKEDSLILKETTAAENLKILENDISTNKSIIADLNDQLIELKSSINSDTAASQTLKTTVNELKSKESSLNKNLADIKNSIEQREEESASLNKKISNEKDIFKENQANNSLFAYELGAFLKEGNENIRLYTFISIVPMLLIVFLSYILLKGTVDLTTIYTINKDMDISTIFWSRLPFVIVITSIIFVCYEITKIFFKKVMEIHHQKLNFSKIGIIAKDVSTTSFDGLDLNDIEKSDLHTKLKMQLLREYLSSEFHIEHDYNINKSLWTRFIEWRKEKDNKPSNKKVIEDVEE